MTVGETRRVAPQGSVTPDDLLARVRAAHESERALLCGFTDDQVRARSELPRWTRGHVLAARIAFLRAADRQTRCALEGGSSEFYAGGRAGRDAEIEAHAGRPAEELVSAVGCAVRSLEERWSRVPPSNWARPVTYRAGSTLMDLLFAAWREAQLHCVDLGLGVRPSAWSVEFCAHLFQFLGSRVPDGSELELTTSEGKAWVVGSGTGIEIRGARTDLAAWMAGRVPEGPLWSSTGTLPELGRLRDGGS